MWYPAIPIHPLYHRIHCHPNVKFFHQLNQLSRENNYMPSVNKVLFDNKWQLAPKSNHLLFFLPNNTVGCWLSFSRKLIHYIWLALVCRCHLSYKKNLRSYNASLTFVYVWSLEILTYFIYLTLAQSDPYAV